MRGIDWRTLETSIELGVWEGDRLANTGDIYRTGRVRGDRLANTGDIYRTGRVGGG